MGNTQKGRQKNKESSIEGKLRRNYKLRNVGIYVHSWIELRNGKQESNNEHPGA